MTKLIIGLSILFVAFFGISDPTVILSGAATDCFQDSLYHVPQVRVAVFDASLNAEMVDSLRAIDALNFNSNLNPEAAMARMEGQYNRVVQLAENSTALGRSITGATGSFEFSLAPVDSVLVFGYYESEDDPFSFAYKVVGGGINQTVALDMSHGSCNYLGQ